MADEQPTLSSRRRSRGSEAIARSSALERLKSLRNGQRRSETTCQIKIDQPIYDTVDEAEYESLVAKRKEEAKGFIVDDDGLGYGDEGEEEDWTKAGYLSYSDEDDDDVIDGEKVNKKKKKVEKKEGVVNKKVPNSGLTAAAALMGKTRISSMFTSNVFKRNDNKTKCGLGLSDSIVDDVIAEFAPDEEDREKRRRHVAISNSVKGVSPVVVKRKTNLGNIELGSGKNCDNLLIKEKENMDGFSDNSKDEIVDDSSNGGELVVDESVVEEKSEAVVKKVDEGVCLFNAKIKDEKDVKNSATAGWKEMMSGGNGNVVGNDKLDGNLSEEKSEFELDSDGSLPFYILDAHEEFYGANMGILYLFGKVCY